MATNNIFLFPTVITHTHREVPQDEKDLWFDAYLKNSDERGSSHDYLGYEEIHLEPNLEFFYRDILMPAVREYFNTLSVSLDLLDVHVTKSFFNVTNESGITRHNHEENHVSFTYYPHVGVNKDRRIIFFDKKRSHANEPYRAFFAHHVTEWNNNNATNYALPAETGTLFVFPSNLDHDVQTQEGDAEDIQPFKTKDDLENSRFCVSGDMMITRKQGVKEYNRSLAPLSNWKTFSSA